MSELKRSAEEMDALTILASLAFGVGFAVYTPMFFVSVAKTNAARGYPDLQSALPKIFKIGFWFCLLAAGANLVALPFTEEEWSVAAVATITFTLLAWRLRCAVKKEPIQSPVPTRGNGT